jgi:hypothetical protein
VTNAKKANNLFMVKSSSRLLVELFSRGIAHAADSQQEMAQLAHRLLVIAESSYARRDFQTVKEASELLLALPMRQAQSAALWYQAFLRKREGSLAEATQDLNNLVADHHAMPRFRAQALHTLGVVARESHHFETARNLFYEAIRYIRRVSPHDTYIFPHSIILHSLTRAEEGDSRQALKELLSIEGLIRVIRNPLLIATYSNNVAVELFELGRVNDAVLYSRVACQSPLAFAYPEWKETALEIEQQTAKRNTVAVVALPKSNSQKRPAQPKYLLVVLRFSLPVRVNRPPAFRQRVTCANSTVALVALTTPIRAPSF